MSNTDRFSMLERWADGMEKLEQYYEGKYGPPTTPPSLPPITTYDAMLEAIADGLQRAKRNINKKSTTYHSDSVAYVKTVPAGDVHYTSLEQIGGRTIRWHQYANPAFTSYTRNGVTVTNNNDGSITVNLTCSAQFSQGIVVSIPFVSGHVYALTDSKNEADYDLLTLGVGFYRGETYTSFMHDFKFNTIRTLTHTNPDVNRIICNVEVHPGTYNNVTIVPQFYDLTEMFGAGNEPSTVAEFQQMFPASYYPYNAGTLLSAGVTSVVSKDADNTTLQTYPIPAEVQALTGYGWSAGTVYNYIDFEAKKFVQEVGSRAYASGDESDSTVVTDMTTTYYPLNPAVETDISAYITDDNLIEVEAGGTLTFPNSNGDDYRIPVPSSVTFVVGEP